MPISTGIWLDQRWQLLQGYDEYDKAWAAAITKGQHDPKVKAGIASNKLDPKQTENDVRYNPILAKHGLASLFGITYDPTPRLRGKLPGETDITLPDGMTIDVIYRGRSDADFSLINDKPESFIADVMVLAVPHDANTIRFAGWISREKFLKIYTTKTFGDYGEKCVVSYHDLESMDLLVPGDYS